MCCVTVSSLSECCMHVLCYCIITFWMLYECAVLLYHHFLNAVCMCCVTVSSLSECCMHVLCYCIHMSPSECCIHMPTCWPSVTPVNYTCWSIFFLHFSHLICFIKCSNIKAISVHNIYCCFHAMHVVRHATNISWPQPPDTELNPVPALNGLLSNICSGTLSWFVSWFLHGFHRIVTWRDDWWLRGLCSMIITILTSSTVRFYSGELFNAQRSTHMKNVQMQPAWGRSEVKE